MTDPDQDPTAPAVDPDKLLAKAGLPCWGMKEGLRLRYTPFDPSPKQGYFLATTCRELFFGGAAGGGKLLETSTPVATPRGFVPIGDLHPGDFVLGADGKTHTVIGESDVVTAPAWKLTFDTGEEVVAHDDHLWNTYTRNERQAVERRNPDYRAARRAKRKSSATGSRSPEFTAAVTKRNQAFPPPTLPIPQPTTRSTAEIVATLHDYRGHTNHSIPVVSPLDLPDADLPIDPYVFGAWLGDGTSRDGAITGMDPEIFDIVGQHYQWRRVSHKAGSKASTHFYNHLRNDLKELGVLNNKHIPQAYLWASESQRLALLQGLMDTDGCVAENSVEFANTNRDIAEGVAHLARSLGMKVTVRETRATLRGVDCGPNWRVKFSANRILFRLPRKVAIQKIGTRPTNRYHYIVAAERTEPVPMKCIQVSNDDGLYLAGHHLIPTHNSVALLAAALQFADVPGYAALILRRKLTDLTQPGALIAMSHEWLDGRPDAKYNANERKWTFASGAVLQFGYLDHVQDVGRYRGPLRPETEVLTDNGWVRIDTVNVGDSVASFDPATRAAGMQPVTATHEFDFDGDLVEVHQRTGVSFAATPEHSIWYRTDKKRDLRRGRVGEVVGGHNQIWVPRNGVWSDGEPPEPREFVPPNRKGPKVPTIRFSPEDWVEFLGWYVSEGNLGVGKNKNQIGITQKKSHHQTRIEALLDRVGARWHRYDDRHYTFSNGALADYLREHCGALSATRRLPREVFGYAAGYRRALLDTLVDGDGSHYPDDGGKMMFVTSSEQLWDDVSELATRCGLTATSGTAPRTKFYGRTKRLEVVEGKVTYRLSITDRHGSDREIRRKDVRMVPYVGKVHCLTVEPWHSIIIRYKGRVSVTGNSEYHFIGWDELGEFPAEFAYTFMFSRVRRPSKLSREAIMARYGAAPDGITLLDLPLRVRGAGNPGGPGMSWVKKRFVDKETYQAPFMPATHKDNPAVGEEYLLSLAMLPEVERRRMELGDWTIQEIPGALWKMDDIAPHRVPWARTDGTSMFDRVYVGLDPSVGGGGDSSDECGIVAAGIRTDGGPTRVVVLADSSGRAHPDVWSQRAVTLHHDLQGSGIVIEKNQGHELLRTQIRDAADQLGLPQPKVLLVNASGSKEFRAGTISNGYRSPADAPLIVHADGLAGGELEAQMVGWIPGAKAKDTVVKSPDRVDALVWTVRGLLYPGEIDNFNKAVKSSSTVVDAMRSW